MVPRGTMELKMETEKRRFYKKAWNDSHKEERMLCEIRADENQKWRRDRARDMQKIMCRQLIFVRRMMSRPQCGGTAKRLG